MLRESYGNKELNSVLSDTHVLKRAECCKRTTKSLDYRAPTRFPKMSKKINNLFVLILDFFSSNSFVVLQWYSVFFKTWVPLKTLVRLMAIIGFPKHFKDLCGRFPEFILRLFFAPFLNCSAELMQRFEIACSKCSSVQNSTPRCSLTLKRSKALTLSDTWLCVVLSPNRGCSPVSFLLSH